MKVTNKLISAGEHIGYILADEGLDEPEYVLKQGVFSELYLTALIESGYKVFNYNADDIEDVSGQKLIDLPEKEVDLDKNMLNYMNEVALSAMSDVDASKYYSYREELSVKFLDPVSVEISTREDLLLYLDQCAIFINKNGYSPDNRPLNSFVAREALFSCDEIKRGGDICKYLPIIEKRRIFRDVRAYKYLIKWLVDNAKLDMRNLSYVSLIQAYMAWGVDGLKDSCIRIDVKNNVDGAFNTLNDRMRNDIGWNRTQHIGILDSNLVLYNGKKSLDISQITEFGREPLILKNDGTLLKYRRNMSTWGSNAIPVGVYEADISNRIYYSLISEEGYPYVFKCTHNRQILYSGGFPMSTGIMFQIRSSYVGITYDITRTPNEDTYYLWNMAIAKANDIIKKVVVPIPVSSTFEMIIKEGVSPLSAIKYIAYQIFYNKDKYSSNGYRNFLDQTPFYMRAMEKYCQPLPDELLKSLEMQNVSYDDIEDFLIKTEDVPDEIIQSLMSDESKNTKGMSPLDKMADALVFKPLSYLDELRFVQNCLDNQVCIGAMGDGMESDGMSNLVQLAEFIMTCSYYELGKDADANKISAYIADFENRTSINIKSILRVRDKGYKGYLEDLCSLRGTRAYTASYWMWVNKVYREMSNESADKQRHYMMEVISYKNDKRVTGQLADAVLKSAKDCSEDVYKLIELSAYYVAARIFYSIIAGALEQDSQGDYHFEYKFNEDKLDVVIDRYLYAEVRNKFNPADNIRYISLYEYCNAEYSESGEFNFMCVNADINPWYVTPKSGMGLKSYNFAVNYQPIEVFNNNSEAWKNKLAECNGKTTYAIGKLNGDQWVINKTMDYMTESECPYTEADISSVLQNGIVESVRSYYKRWMFTRKSTKGVGTLVRMPLKQDIVYGGLAKYFGVDSSQDLVIDEIGSYKGSEFLTTLDPIVISGSKTEYKGIESNGSKAKKIKIIDIPFDIIISATKVLRGTFRPSCNTFMGSSMLTILQNGSKLNEYRINELNDEMLNTLAAKQICYQINRHSFLFFADNGVFIVEA